ncbi:hypothetical protein [Micromonospora sp. DT227]|uniref:hypothetical protein n=1 Tax=Micromonospora sp. DT227 TaxID=3393433 RepID=UPI003CFB73C1
MRPGLRTGRLSSRLFVTQSLIVAAGAVTLVLVAFAVVPGLFRSQLHRMMAMSAGMTQDLESALITTLLVALGVAVGAALLMSLG